MLEVFEELEILSDDKVVKVILENLWEGLSGEYDPDDPDDINMIRFSVHRFYRTGEIVEPYFTDLRANNREPIVNDEEQYLAVTNASYCSSIEADTDAAVLEQFGKLILREVESNVRSQMSVKHICEQLSWFCVEDLAEKRHPRNREDLYRFTLLKIGAQHPAWSSNPDDKLVQIFNLVLATAREAVGAQGADDDAKADWCEHAAEEYKRGNSS